MGEKVNVSVSLLFASVRMGYKGFLQHVNCTIVQDFIWSVFFYLDVWVEYENIYDWIKPAYFCIQFI